MKKELNEQQRRELNTESFKASEESQMNEEEWQARIDLAALYRLAAHFGYDDLIWNHITMRVPGTDHQFLLNKFGLLYNEVCLLYTSPSPRDNTGSRMPSSA